MLATLLSIKKETHKQACKQFFKNAKISHMVRKAESMFSEFFSKPLSHKKWVTVLPLPKRCHVAKENKMIKNSLHKTTLLNTYYLISFNNKHYKQNIWKTQCWNNNLTKVPQLEWTLFTQWQTWYHYLCTLIKQERGSFERRVLNSKSQTCGSLWLCFLFSCL